MLKREIKSKTCECGYYGKFIGKKCRVCTQKKYQANRIKKLKPTGEKQLFKQLWDERPRKSAVSNKPLRDFNIIYFSHILPKGKGKYPHFKLYEKNIVFMTWEEHTTWEYYKFKIKYHPDWEWVFKLETELKEEYKTLYGI